jgi:hypothetical protein
MQVRFEYLLSFISLDDSLLKRVIDHYHATTIENKKEIIDALEHRLSSNN